MSNDFQIIFIKHKIYGSSMFKTLCINYELFNWMDTCGIVSGITLETGCEFTMDCFLWQL